MNEEKIISVINELPLDLRVEIVVGDIIASGFDMADLFVNPVGIFQRRFNKDILNAELLEFKNEKQAVLVNTVREGVYDMLPQLLFHNRPAKNSNAFKTVRNMIDEYKARVEEEKEARKFFMVYEAEFFRQRIANAMHERNLLDAISYSMDDNEILSYWKLPQMFDRRQKGILFYLFPVFHKIRGMVEYMQEVYRIILNQEIVIEKSSKNKLVQFDDADFTLGNIFLSSNSIIGKSYNYYYPTIVVRVENLSKENLFDYLPGAKNIHIIEKLNEYFMPLFCETELKVEIEKSNWVLNPSDKNESRLDYTICI